MGDETKAKELANIIQLVNKTRIWMNLLITIAFGSIKTKRDNTKFFFQKKKNNCIPEASIIGDGFGWEGSL